MAPGRARSEGALSPVATRAYDVSYRQTVPSLGVVTMALRFRPHRSLLLLVVWLCIALPLAACSGGRPDAAPAQPAPQAGIQEGQGCTIFYAADDNVALGGNNEDFWNPFTYMWFVPGESGTYGRVYFGFEDGYPQGGVNEAGLFFDGAALPYRPLPGWMGLSPDSGKGL